MSDTANTSVDAKKPYHWLAPYQVKPGEVLNPKGRTKGARSKLGEQFVQALQEDFEKHGKSVIEKVRTDRPQDYLKVLASILPKELNVKVDALGEMSDDELTDTLGRLRDFALAFDAQIARSGAKEAGGEEPALELQALQ